jgi:hypothetical protein
MRLHSNILRYSHIHSALEAAKAAGKVDRSVQFETLDDKGSRTRDHAFEVQLGWYGNKVAGDGRRWKNSGNRGANSYDNGTGVYAATYDEWGWFIAELYRIDPNLVFGHYKDRATFLTMTKHAYK